MKPTFCVRPFAMLVHPFAMLVVRFSGTRLLICLCPAIGN
jgi:hypothetical protein